MIETPDPNSPVRTRHMRMVVALMVAVALLGVGVWWSTHPSRFSSVGDELGAVTTIGKPLLITAEARPSSQVVLRDARARVRENTADATIRLVFCTDTPSYGAYAMSAQEHCGRVIPVSGARLGPELTSGRQLMVEVTPRRRGTVVLDGFDVTYRAGLRWGSESTGMVIKVRTKP